MSNKYRTPKQRESIIWLMALRDKLERYAEDWNSMGRQLITKEIVPQLDAWGDKLVDGINVKEGNALMKMSKQVNPMLVDSDYSETDDKILVDADTFYTIAEYALDYCRTQAVNKHIMGMTNAKEIKAYLKANSRTCSECKDPDNCKLRQELLTLMVPAFTLNGPCQYWREEVENE
jgi:hypothetical protein